MRIGVDIGGTFTDVVVVDERGDIGLRKSLSTPDDLWRGIAEGLKGLDLGRAELIVHGTTVGINALLEGKGEATGLITTRGFRDVYEIGRHNREEMYDLFYAKPVPLVPRRHRLEVRERIDARGRVLVPLEEADVLAAIDHFKRHDIRSIAVCLLHSYANPEHEIKIGQIIARCYPEALVSLSHELAREWREYERTSTTVINAYIMPKVRGYLDKMERELERLGYIRPLFISQSNGGLVSTGSAVAKPVHTIMSGPAGGVAGGLFFGRLLGYENLITFDMGGTSTDVALIHCGAARMTVEARIERRPLMVPMIDIRSIGAGGGSIAWLKEGRALNVGPGSAGADPGPACYGRGGAEPTVTDANLALGRLHPRFFLGSEMKLERSEAEKAIARRIAAPLGLGLDEAARGIVRIVNTKMAHAIRAITIQRGFDPKDFVLLAFGGAGPMHACSLAAELGIPKIVVPLYPGNFSALGMLTSDVRHDFSRTCLARWDKLDIGLISGLFGELEREALLTLKREGLPEDRIVCRSSIDMRYIGQEYTVNVPLDSMRLAPAHLAQLRSQFDSLHEMTYGHSSTAEPVELVNLRLTALGRSTPLELKPIERGTERAPRDSIVDELEVFFEESVYACPVYNRAKLLAGNRIPGPALIIEKGATTVLEPGFVLEVSEHGNLIIVRSQDNREK